MRNRKEFVSEMQTRLQCLTAMLVRWKVEYNLSGAEESEIENAIQEMKVVVRELPWLVKNEDSFIGLFEELVKKILRICQRKEG